MLGTGSCANPPATSRPVKSQHLCLSITLWARMEFSCRNDGTIWACGRRNLTAPLPAPDESVEPAEELVKELSSYAKRWIKWSCKCAGKQHKEFELVGKGRGFRPTTPSNLPIISEVPSSCLAGQSSGRRKATNNSSGMFVSWGHGGWGLTLGMGSGKLMSQLMLGEQPDLDLSAFSFSKGCKETGCLSDCEDTVMLRG